VITAASGVQRYQVAASFDHLVGTGQQGGWDGKAERPGRSEINR
jgi:hypothetical protein